MNASQAALWKDELLNEVLLAVASSPDLRDCLIFKGARVLQILLNDQARQSLDLDSNLSLEFADQHHKRQDRIMALKELFTTAFSRYFARQSPVRYKLLSVVIEMNPRTLPHPFGWDGTSVRISVKDFKHAGVLGLPSIEIDVSSPEDLSPESICSLPVSCGVIKAYTLSRMAGEKMRAFLSSLPAYQAKIGRRADSRRVKDLFDLARICRRKPVSDLSFWRLVGEEFRRACKSRFIDCDGLSTFAEDFEETKRRYAEDQTFRGRIPFDEAWETITLVLQFLGDSRIIPFYFPIVPIERA